MTAVCTKRIMEETKGIGQKYRKMAMKDCFIFEIWFSSKNLVETAMEVGAELIGMVKTNQISDIPKELISYKKYS